MFVGVPVGNIVASAVGGRLCAAFGWRSVFWFAGACNVVFVLLWFRSRRSSNSTDLSVFDSGGNKNQVSVRHFRFTSSDLESSGDQ